MPSSPSGGSSDDDDSKRPPPGAGASTGLKPSSGPSPVSESPPHYPREPSPKDKGSRPHLKSLVTSTPKHLKQDRPHHRQTSPRIALDIPSVQSEPHRQPEDHTSPKAPVLHVIQPTVMDPGRQSADHSDSTLKPPGSKHSVTPSDKVAHFSPPDTSNTSDEPKKDEPRGEAKQAEIAQDVEKPLFVSSELKRDDHSRPDLPEIDPSDREEYAESYDTSLPPSTSQTGRPDGD